MMRREDYKAKHMDKTQMEKYLQTVYQAKAADGAPEAEG